METATEAEFDAVIAKGRVVVEFSADWCGTCRAMKPTVEAMAADLAGSVRVVVVDADANPGLTTRFGVRALPTFLVFSEGLLAGKLVGAVDRADIEDLLGHRMPEDE